MTNTKWLRRALLGGVALSVMATGAQADELSDLKAQLETLQGRVNQLEQQPAAAIGTPEGASFLTVSRGQGSMGDFGRLSRVHDNIPDDRGFTISVTPTADIPAPVAEVVVYGYVKGDVIYDFDQHHLGDAFYIPNIWSQNGRKDAGIRLHAKQSRFGIRSKVDTAVGQVRTLIEGDFFSSDNHFRLRHAWGEWDMTPYWTFGAGQYWQTAALLPIGITTVDFSGDAGPFGYTRRAQVRLTYHNGPISGRWQRSVRRGRPTPSGRTSRRISSMTRLAVTSSSSPARCPTTTTTIRTSRRITMSAGRSRPAPTSTLATSPPSRWAVSTARANRATT